MADMALEVVTQSSRRSLPGGNGGTIRPFDAAASLEANRKRWDKRARLAREALASAAGQIMDAKDKPVGVDAWAWWSHVVEQHGMNAADPSAYGSVQSLKFVSDAAFPKPERDQGSSVPPGGAQLNLSPELVQSLLVALRQAGEK